MLVLVFLFLSLEAVILTGVGVGAADVNDENANNNGGGGHDDFWGKKTIERDLERFSEHCDAVFGAHQDRWLKLYETNERVLTIDASCSERANGIGNYLGDV